MLDSIASFQLDQLPLRVVAGNSLDASALEQLGAFRSRILYNNGQRPAFHPEGERANDRDDTDSTAYHVMVCPNGTIVGYMRLHNELSRNTIYLNYREAFSSFLDHEQAQPSQCYEASRWLVDPGWRSKFMGDRLFAVAMAVVLVRNGEIMVGKAGNCQGQSHFLEKAVGCRGIPGITNHFSEEYNDDVSFLFLRRRNFTSRFKALVDLVLNAMNESGVSALLRKTT